MERDDGMKPDVIPCWRLLFVKMVMALLVFSVFMSTEPTLADEGEAHRRIWNFDQEPAGALPRLFVIGATLDGRSAGEWKVIDMNETSWLDDLDQREHKRIEKVLQTLEVPSPPHVLAQLKNRGFEQDYHVILVEGTMTTDLDLSVSLLPVAGKGDMGGGLIWRAQDAQNYYITRANPLEQNIRLYRVVNGVRYKLANFDHIISVDKWHTFRVVARDNHFQIIFDGQMVLDVRDETFQSGRIGLWTKADAVTYFDDLRLSVVE
jgi:hypothetical protein